MRVHRYLAVMPLALCLAPAPAFCADEKVPGDEWEATVRMSMPGMAMQMPPQTAKVCREKNRAWDGPPMDKQTEDRCKVSGWQVSGNHATWKVTCEGGMSGTGDMTFTPDSYTGTMNVSMEGRAMKMDLSGKKTGKDCDAMENARAMQRAQKQAADAQEYLPGGSKDPMIAACNEAAASGNRSMFMGPGAQCKKPEQKEAFCKAAVTRKAFDGYIKEAGGQQTVAKEVTAFCGTSIDFVLKNLCADALAHEDLTFLANNCPDKGKELAQKYCAGRKFSSIPEETVRNFCIAYAEKLLKK
jgi:hypothetical protein